MRVAYSSGLFVIHRHDNYNSSIN